jgi:Cys-tRNA(Pro) deacylase
MPKGVCPIITDRLTAPTMERFSTKITNLLDENDIPYRLLPHTEPVFTVDTAAAQRGVIKEEMVKSILLREKKGRRYVMACVTGDSRLDPKAVRAHLPVTDGWKRLTFATAAEIQAVTGYVQGAVAPLCLPENVPVIFDVTIAQCPKVNISSGDPMAGLELATQDLIRLAGAEIAPIAEGQGGE